MSNDRQLTDEEIKDIIALSENTVKIYKEAIDLGITSIPLRLSIDDIAELIVQPAIDELGKQIVDAMEESDGESLH